AGDLRLRRVGALGRVRPVGVVQRPGDDDDARGGEDAPNIGAAFGGASEIAHVARIAASEPRLQESELWQVAGGGDPGQIEPEVASLRFDRRGRQALHRLFATKQGVTKNDRRVRTTASRRAAATRTA